MRPPCKIIRFIAQYLSRSIIVLWITAHICTSFYFQVGAVDVIVSEDFEGAWPNTWYVGNDGGVTGYVWGDNSYRPHSGSWSGFCADNGDNSAHTYPNNLHTYMERRGVDLSEYTHATLVFYYWLNSEYGYDFFTVNVRDQQGQWHELFRDSGNNGTWVYKTLSLDDFCGQTGLYVQFRFDSDSSITSEGVWIDDVRLEASSTGNLEVQVKDEEGNNTPGARLLLYDSNYNYMGDSYIRYTNSEGVAYWTGLETGDYNIEVYHEGTSPFPGAEFWVSQRVTVTGGGTSSAVLERNRPFASQVLIKDAQGNPVYESAWINPGSITIEVTVENRCNWDQTVRVHLLLDRDKRECYDIDSENSYIVPANSSRTFGFNPYVGDTAVGDETYNLALCVESLINGHFVKTDAWNWWEKRFNVSHYIKTGAFGSSLSPPSCPPAIDGCTEFEDNFTNPSLDNWQVRYGMGEPQKPGPQYWSGDEKHCAIVNDPLADDGKALRLVITRSTCSDYTVGAEVSTKEYLGYGTYSVRLRIAGDPGFVVGAFLYKDYGPNEYTEIDFEWLSRFFGAEAGELFCISYQEDDPPIKKHVGRASINDVSQYHVYTFIWEPNRIVFKIDNEFLAEFFSFIPWLKAPFVINIWSGSARRSDGSIDSPDWSGQFDRDSSGEVYIDWFRYTPLLPPPDDISASNGTYPDKVRVTWSSVSGATYYEVYRASSSDGSYSKLDGNITTTSYDDTSVTPGQHYWYKVKACNDCGCSGYSSYDEGWAQANPALCRSTSSLDFGTSATSKTFEVWNCGGGTLTYTISDDRTWISVSPTSGSSTGEHDTITVTVNRSGLSPGHYTGTVTIDPNYGSNQSVAISMDVPPPNDDFADAQTITGNAGAVTGTNRYATKESGEPNHAGNSGGASVWYKWTAPFTGQVIMGTWGSDFDTLLAVYTGSSVGSLSEVASNDDWGGRLTSRVEFNATAGVTYRIAVDGYGGDQGSLVLAWSPDTAAVFRVERTTGDVKAEGSYYGYGFESGSADVAEWVPVSEEVEPGDVLEIDPEHPGYYRKARGPCSSLVAGVVSTAPGFVLGHTGDSEGKALLALIGIVPVKVTDEGGPISPGDLLVVSSTPGYAMRWDPESGEPCGLVGKALEPLERGERLIHVLLVH